jgi:hypothetical protein
MCKLALLIKAIEHVSETVAWMFNFISFKNVWVCTQNIYSLAVK